MLIHSFIWYAYLFIIGSLWSSFLACFAARLLRSEFFLRKKRSMCPACGIVIKWYDLVPIISWIVLRGACRTCKGAISYAYPLTEVVGTVYFFVISVFFLNNPYMFIAYFVLGSLVIISVFTDLVDFVLLRYVTLYAIPVGILCALLGFLPITVWGSISGACVGYGIFALIDYIYICLRGCHGVGDGDGELLALMGSFVGPLGAVVILMCAACVGSFFGLFSMLITRTCNGTLKLPFGPFLAIGLLIWIIINYFFVGLF